MLTNSNIVEKDIVRMIQKDTLSVLAKSVGTSAGPIGADTQISKDGSKGKQDVPFAINVYTKDGHTILSSINFDDIISDSVKSNLTTITSNVVKRIGDGTTSAVLMSDIVFNKLVELEKSETRYKVPRFLINDFKAAVTEIQKKIRENKREFNPEAAYNIAYISSNGNEELATDIKNIYEKYGNDVFIEAEASPTKESYIRELDGMSLNTGYTNVSFMTDLKTMVAEIHNPKIYYFKDPVDTPEQIAFLCSIINHNIIKPYSENNFGAAIPTVILAKHVSRDASGQLDKILSFMDGFNDPGRIALKPPLLMVSNIHQEEELDDIARLCGCKEIQKYLDPKQQDADQKAGVAPTLENIWEFYGEAETVRADATSTVVINPSRMYDENGELSEVYKASLSNLQAQLAQLENETNDLNVLGSLRRRINSLNSKAITYFVGGVTATDRDSLKYLVDDSILNCRSAAKDGVGYAANTEGFLACSALAKENPDNKMYALLEDCYRELLARLYGTNPALTDRLEEIYEGILEGKGPMNIITEEFDKNVLSSIETDAAILECISRVITLMITCTQCVLPTSAYNKYGNIKIK